MIFTIIFLCVFSALLCFLFDRFVCSRFPDDGRFQLLPWFLCGYLASISARLIVYYFF